MARAGGKKLLLIAVAALAVLFVAAAIVVPRLIDLNTYHDRIVREAEAAIGRPVRLGDMQLSLLPPVGVRVRDVAIGAAAAGEPDLLSVAEVSVRLKVWPLLLHRDVEIASIDFEEPSVFLHRLADGRWDLPQPAAAAPEAAPPPGA
ncbi:MAG: AsmA family protein, partial [Anaerolineales bacterium]